MLKQLQNTYHITDPATLKPTQAAVLVNLSTAARWLVFLPADPALTGFARQADQVAGIVAVGELPGLRAELEALNCYTQEGTVNGTN